MSRSVHSNRSWRLFEQRGFHDWTAIATKRAIKRLVDRSRHGPDVVLAQSAQALTILVVDTSPPHFFPASRDDVDAVLRALPPGSTQGLTSVRLVVGAQGESGDEVYPGVRVPSIRGTYSADVNDIRIFAYARDPGAVISGEQAQELRFKMLRTLVHEVAHHCDLVARVGRGRWRMDNNEKAERYADETAIEWCLEVVIPYLTERYGQPSAGAV